MTTTTTIHEIAIQVAMRLRGWSYDYEASHFRDEQEERPNWIAIVEGPEGAALRIGTWEGCSRSMNVRDDTKLDISGRFPEFEGHCFQPRDGKFQIGVTAGRGAETIVREIERRLLPKYLPAYQECKKRRDDYVDSDRRKRAAYDGLTALLDEQPSEWMRRECKACGHGIEIQVISDDDVVMTVRRATPALATQIIDLVRHAEA